MKKLLPLLIIPLIFFLGCDSPVKINTGLHKGWPTYITDLPFGIDVYHSSNIVYAKNSTRNDNYIYPYILEFGTTVMAIDHDLEIIEFGAFKLIDNEWVLVNTPPRNKKNFIEWYHGNNDGVIYEGFKYSDNENFLMKGKKLNNSEVKFLIYFIGKNKRGVKYVGAKEVSGKLSFK